MERDSEFGCVGVWRIEYGEWGRDSRRAYFESWAGVVGGADFTAVGDDRAEGRLIRGFSFALGFWGLGVGRFGVVVGVSAGVPGSRVSGRSRCRVAAFRVFAGYTLAIFFITVSRCA